MNRREFLLGAGTASLGGSAMIGTGAFSRVEAQRAVAIEVAEDPDAYLGFDPCPGGDGAPTPNAEFVTTDARGRMAIDMGDSENGGDGVNANAVSSFDDVFRISNQGKAPTCVDLAYDPVAIPESDGEFEAGDPSVVFYRSGARTEGSSSLDEALVFDPDDADPDDPDSAVNLDVGESVCVGIQTRTFGIDATDDPTLLDGDRVRIVADTDGTCADGGDENGDGGDGGDGDRTVDAERDISFVAFGDRTAPSVSDVEVVERKADSDGDGDDSPVSVAYEADGPIAEAVLFVGGGPGVPPGDQLFAVASDLDATGVVTTRDPTVAPDDWVTPDETVLRSETPREPSEPFPSDDREGVKFDWDESDGAFRRA